MAIHPKVLDRATKILESSEEKILEELENISNTTVLGALYTLEQSNNKRQAVLDCLAKKIGKEPGDNEQLSQLYFNEITESEEEVIVFDTTLNKQSEEDEKVDSSDDHNKLGSSS